MCSENLKRMTDFELMNLAKRRVEHRTVFKWHVGIYLIASFSLMAIFLFVSKGNLWLVLGTIGWGLLVAFHGIGVSILLSGSCPIASDEYNRLKGYAIVAKKMNGENQNETNN